jgi:NAD(P)H dehydrogenase (quinone)
MRVLVVLAHPERRSFNGQMADRAAGTLLELGHEVELIDLYEQRFDAREAAWHYPSRPPDNAFDVQAEQRSASDEGVLPEPVASMLDRVEQADLIILQFPIWWFAPPAILKGWIDRVLVYGRTYSSQLRYDRGRLTGRKAMLSVTTGGGEQTFAHNGRNGDINLVLWPTQMSLHYVGFEVLPPYVAFGVSGDRADPATRAKLSGHLSAYSERLVRLDELAPLGFPKWADFDENGRLRPEAGDHNLFIRQRA